MNLEEFFKENPSVALGFSGGTDSSYLLWAARECGAAVGAYFVKTAFQPLFELQDAQRLAYLLGAELSVIEYDILSRAEVAANPADRCYRCKRAIFGLIAGRAKKDGWPLLIDGTNASDDATDRPGMRALTELRVRSPLRECGITKERVRALSKEAGLFTWNKPAYACLATRIPEGEGITAESLALVERSEDALFALGFSDLRVRLRGEAARLELPEAQHSVAREKWKDICGALAEFESIELACR